MLLRLSEVEKRIGDRVLFTNASVVVRARDRIGIVGPNGAGKTTLLHIISGDQSYDGGQIHRARDMRLGLLRQEIDPRAGHSVREEAQTALGELDRLETEMRDLEAEMSRRGGSAETIPRALSERYDIISHRFAQSGGFERHARVSEILSGLGFPEKHADRPLSSFSGGWLMRVELAKLLLSQPDVLLLDEPTNHLDLPSIQFFESTLERFPGAVLIVSHDRTFLRRQTNRIIELDTHGHFMLYEGGYDRYLDQRAQRRAERLAQKKNQDRQIAEKERFIARFSAKASKARQAQSRIKALEKIERIQIESEQRKAIRLRIPKPRRSGDRVLSLRNLHKSYGDEIIYAGVDFQIRRGEKVALIGPNGAGKSTLLRIAAGVIDFDSGQRDLGHNVELAFFAQHQLESLDPASTVLEEVSRDARIDEIPRLRAHLGALLFTGDDVDKKISVLSGGEKARVAFAKLLLRPANLLVLDEPTNHLDVEACEVLEEAFRAYEGTLLFVSHDRSFINALATRVVDVEGGKLEDHLGNYDAYMERRTPTELATKAETSIRPATTVGANGLEKPDKAARQKQREWRKKREKIARKIERLETLLTEKEEQKDALTWKLGEPEVHQDRKQSQVLREEHTQLTEEIETLYREWERLTDEFGVLDDTIEG
jgi:ATP-binding cassette subfamily F protein 3